jgi:hypothetical protein
MMTISYIVKIWSLNDVITVMVEFALKMVYSVFAYISGNEIAKMVSQILK